MANKYLNRKFTLRESLLLLLLAVVLCLGLYFGLVFYPTQRRASDVDKRAAALEIEIQKANSQKDEYDYWKKTLETVDKSTVMPEYNNNVQQTLLYNRFQYEIFVGIAQKSIDCHAVHDLGTGVIARTGSFNFTVKEAERGTEATVYDKVKSLLNSLMTTGYRCSMSTLQLTPQGGDLKNATEISVNCRITFYERGTLPKN